MSGPIEIRALRPDERAAADAQYVAMQFAPTPPEALALAAECAGVRVGLGRLVAHAPDVVELGGIWTAEAHRGHGVARAMVHALLARHARGALWCIPFAHLAAFYQSFGFAPSPPPWPAPIAAKVAACVAHGQDIVVLAR
jgi:GNAT superfamily N-acetyltransferase